MLYSYLRNADVHNYYFQPLSFWLNVLTTTQIAMSFKLTINTLYIENNAFT